MVHICLDMRTGKSTEDIDCSAKLNFDITVHYIFILFNSPLHLLSYFSS